MPDIVKQLRNPPFGTETSESKLMSEAADEINRLRMALSFYADVSKCPAPLTGGLGELYFDCGTIARAALEESK